MSDKKYSNSDYLLGKVDPFGLEDPYASGDSMKYMTPPQTGISNLYKPTYKLPTQEKKEPAKKPQSKFDKRVQDQTLAVSKERVKNEKTYNLMQQARMLDNKIKRSKKPSYEDLQEFHKLSQAMEDIGLS